MNRLTFKHNDFYLSKAPCTDDLVLKLGELEDIEEELGIDLPTLFKAINSKSIWIKSYKIVEHIEDEYNERVWRLQDGHLYTYWEDGSHCCLEISNYGKTWSLRKEDLKK